MSAILAKHTLTVYNKIAGVFIPPFPPSESWQRTIIKFAQWEDQTDLNANGNGRNTIDKHISIIIPKNAKSQGRKYLTHIEWNKLQSGQDKYWTLIIESTMIALGETPDISASMTITDLQKQYKSCLVSAVEDLTIQPILPHFEVVGI